MIEQRVITNFEHVNEELAHFHWKVFDEGIMCNVPHALWGRRKICLQATKWHWLMYVAVVHG